MPFGPTTRKTALALHISACAAPHTFVISTERRHTCEPRHAVHPRNCLTSRRVKHVLISASPHGCGKPFRQPRSGRGFREASHWPGRPCSPCASLNHLCTNGVLLALIRQCLTPMQSTIAIGFVTNVSTVTATALYDV